MKISTLFGVMTLGVSIKISKGLASLGLVFDVNKERSLNKSNVKFNHTVVATAGVRSVNLNSVSILDVFESLSERYQQGKPLIAFFKGGDGNYYLDVPNFKALGPFNGLKDNERPYQTCYGDVSVPFDVVDVPGYYVVSGLKYEGLQPFFIINDRCLQNYWQDLGFQPTLNLNKGYFVGMKQHVTKLAQICQHKDLERGHCNTLGYVFKRKHQLRKVGHTGVEKWFKNDLKLFKFDNTLKVDYLKPGRLLSNWVDAFFQLGMIGLGTVIVSSACMICCCNYLTFNLKVAAKQPNVV